MKIWVKKTLPKNINGYRENVTAENHAGPGKQPKVSPLDKQYFKR